MRVFIKRQFLAILPLATVACGCATPQDLQVRSIELRDDEGHVRMRAALEDSTPQLLLLSPEGKVLIRLQGTSQGGEATVCDAHGTLRVLITTNPDTRIALYDSKSVERASIICSPHGEVTGLLLTNPNDESAVVVELQANGSAKLLIRDRDGKILWSAPAK